MGDWTAALGILLLALLWIQVFVNYRRKLVRILLSVTKATNLQHKEFIEVTGHRALADWRNCTFPEV